MMANSIWGATIVGSSDSRLSNKLATQKHFYIGSPKHMGYI